jgi:hypothetical protein
VAVGLGLLMWLSLQIMMALHVEGGADIDSINFGLAALRFDLLQHQPHPPGYPGYVVLLKLIHFVFPSLGPVAIAEWGSRLCGLLSIPVAYGVCRRLMENSPDVGRPLLAATFVAFHPMLLKYGSDGQSHAAEALCTLILFGATVQVVRASTRTRRLLLVAGFALAGAIRPNIPLLCAPLLLWVFWRQPLKEWALAALVGLGTVVLWMVPLVVASGGWALYRRATNALLLDFFGATYSLFGARATAKMVATNVNVAILSSAIAAIPLIAWTRGKSPWRSALWRTVLLNVAFYSLFYCAETGYLIAVAVLSCLVPASWPTPMGRALRLRVGLAVMAGPLFLFSAPAQVPLLTFAKMSIPSFRNAAELEVLHSAFRALMCESAGGEPSLAFSNNVNIGLHRGVPLQCPNIMFASSLKDLKLNPKLDNVVIARDRGLIALPTGIPLELGEPVEYRPLVPIKRVLVAPDATPWFVEEIARQARCPRLVAAERGEGDAHVLVWPAQCFPRLQIGRNAFLLSDGPEKSTDPSGPL